MCNFNSFKAIAYRYFQKELWSLPASFSIADNSLLLLLFNYLFVWYLFLLLLLLSLLYYLLLFQQSGVLSSLFFDLCCVVFSLSFDIHECDKCKCNSCDRNGNLTYVRTIICSCVRGSIVGGGAGCGVHPESRFFVRVPSRQPSPLFLRSRRTDNRLVWRNKHWLSQAGHT